MSSNVDTVENLVPIWEKWSLTLEEAAEYFGIGINRLRDLSNQPNDFTLKVGTKRLLKRKSLERYLETVNQV